MISHSKKFIFIHIPKTAGNSIQLILKEHSSDKIHRLGYDSKSNLDDRILIDFEVESSLGKHSKHEWIQSYYKNPELKQVVDDYFKFAVVRDPWDRLVSWYRYTFPTISLKVNKGHFLKEAVEAGPLGGFSCLPQLNYLRRDGDSQSETAMDYIVKYENLEEGLKEVGKKINVSFESLPHINKCQWMHLSETYKKTPYQDYYDKKTEGIIRERHKEEIELFDYEFVK
jgi:hypothetical protein